jgi:hypothetical protein
MGILYVSLGIFAVMGILSGADPGFVVRGGVGRRGVWGPRPQRVQGRALVGGPGDEAPWKLWGFEELQTFI